MLMFGAQKVRPPCRFPLSPLFLPRPSVEMAVAISFQRVLLPDAPTPQICGNDVQRLVRPVVPDVVRGRGCVKRRHEHVHEESGQGRVRAMRTCRGMPEPFKCPHLNNVYIPFLV